MTDHESWLPEKMSDRGGSLIASPLALIKNNNKKNAGNKLIKRHPCPDELKKKI
jgi:hypothetical protein